MDSISIHLIMELGVFKRASAPSDMIILRSKYARLSESDSNQ